MMRKHALAWPTCEHPTRDEARALRVVAGPGAVLAVGPSRTPSEPVAGPHPVVIA